MKTVAEKRTETQRQKKSALKPKHVPGLPVEEVNAITTWLDGTASQLGPHHTVIPEPRYNLNIKTINQIKEARHYRESLRNAPLLTVATASTGMPFWAATALTSDPAKWAPVALLINLITTAISAILITFGTAEHQDAKKPSPPHP